MADVTRSGSWTEELASLIDGGIRYSTIDDSPYLMDQFIDSSVNSNHTELQFDAHLHSTMDSKQTHFGFEEERRELDEDLKDKIKGFAKAWGELLIDLSIGCKDIVQQSLSAEDSYVVKKFGPYLSRVSSNLGFLNEYLPEDRDPLHAWPVVFFVFILALAAPPVVKKMVIHPPSAATLLLPDGRHMAYHDQGVAANRARYTLIAPHAFLSSRLAGIPGIKASLLEEFGVRLVTYDLPGFGESDPHPSRDLNTSALDVHYLANDLGVYDKFWVLGYSTAAMHAWATLKYIPNRIAGAAFVAPMVNPYDPAMTKEESSKIWERWDSRRKLMFSVARRFPSFLSYFYRRSFFSGKHGNIKEWFSVSLSEKDETLTRSTSFETFWQRNVEESVRQGHMKPLIKEAMLQVSEWGFSLGDLQTRRRCPRKGILPWLKSIYSKSECELTGFSGPIYLWQGMNDTVVPPSMAHYISRILPGVNLHQLPSDGHFSYFYFCDECHREILTTLFGDPLGPIHNTNDTTQMDDTDPYLLNQHEDEDHVFTTDTV
ncbi:hypothetical protein RND81_04G067900 [Saponaria officinalis]|uniref:AB hydrolase-1 domain-containing protein n=1 Tax=Saponaria officinalis TaxID=3572 RepID=A0AAW1LJK5_SAPOF